MEVFYLILGITLLAIALIDIMWTSLWVDGRVGPLSGTISRNIWKFVRKISGSNNIWMSLTGPLLLIFTLIMWITLIWLGWTFIYAVDPQSITDTLNEGAITWSERFYFVGYSLFTLGNGNYAPKIGLWQIISVIVSGFGMLFLTFGVSYILNIVNAVVQKRSFATDLTGVAKSPEKLIEMGWDGEGFNQLISYFLTLTDKLSSLTQQHKAYPLLFYYHSTNKEEATSSSLSILDETITFLEYGVDLEVKINPVIIKNIRSNISSYIENAQKVYNISEHKNTIPAPDFEVLEEAGIPTVSKEKYEEDIQHLENRRKLLAGLLKENGREISDSWKEMNKSQ